MKKVYQSLLAATCKFFGLPAPRGNEPVCVDQKRDYQSGPSTTTTPPAEPDKESQKAEKKPWLIKLPIGAAIKDSPKDRAWMQGQELLPDEITDLMFSDMDKLKEVPLVACLPSSLKLPQLNGTLPYADLELRLDGKIKCPTEGKEYEIYTLLMVIDPNCSEYPNSISCLFYYDLGASVKFYPSTYVSGGIVTPMHFCLGLDEDHRSYRTKTIQHHMEEDTYHVVLSVLDHAPTWYDKESFVRYLNEDNSFTKRLREGTLFGEASQPSLKNYPNPCDREARIFEIDLSNVGFVVKDIWTIDDTPIGYAGNAHPSVTMVMGKIKPTGPMADVVRAHLENPAPRSHFGMRGLITPGDKRRNIGNKIYAIVTFDLMH